MDWIGKPGGKPRPLRINIRIPAERRKLLYQTKRLRDMKEYEKVYISPDLTRLQQEEDKHLRDKVKEFKQQGLSNVKIVRGQVVSETDGRKEILFPLGEPQ